MLWNGDAPINLGIFVPVFLTDTGDIYGNISSGHGTASTWHDCTLTALSIAGSCFQCVGSVAVGANHRGQVVGQYIKAFNGDSSCFGTGDALWQNGVLTDMGPNAEPLGINDKNQIVGQMFIQTVGNVAGIWKNLQFSLLTSLQTYVTDAYAASAINIMEPLSDTPSMTTARRAQ